MINLETIGFELLTEKTKEDFQKIFDEYSKKIERRLNNAESFRVMLKEYSRGGKIKFSIHVMVSFAGKNLEANASDWDLNRTCRKAFNKIEQLIEHRFRISDQNKR